MFAHATKMLWCNSAWSVFIFVGWTSYLKRKKPKSLTLQLWSFCWVLILTWTSYLLMYPRHGCFWYCALDARGYFLDLTMSCKRAAHAKGPEGAACLQRTVRAGSDQIESEQYPLATRVYLLWLRIFLPHQEPQNKTLQIRMVLQC